MKAYATQDCIDFAAGAGDQTKISLHASAWCKAGKPCRSKLRNPVDAFRAAGGTIDSSTKSKEAARAIMNAEICSVNHSEEHCAQFMQKLYEHANKQLQHENVKTQYKPSCSVLKARGELDKMGCCVATFAQSLTDMRSAASKTWNYLRDDCGKIVPAVKKPCALINAAGREALANAYLALLLGMLSALYA